MNSVEPLLQQHVRSLFDAEVQFNVLLPRMIEKSTDTLLREGLSEISADTRKNLQQIQDVCTLLQVPPTGVVCKTMQDLVREAAEATRAAGGDAAIDAGLIERARSIVQYEIASFNLACLFAQSLGNEDACLLLANLTHRADSHERLLTQIALETAG